MKLGACLVKLPGVLYVYALINNFFGRYLRCLNYRPSLLVLITLHLSEYCVMNIYFVVLY